MANDNMIIWEKWRDPFGDKDEDIDIEQDDGLGDFFDADNDQKDSDQDIASIDQKFLSKQIKVIATPMGIIPINDNTASGKIFNFWVGHTNFNITKGVSNVIETSDGVETLDVFTRYRFRIGIGKAFKDSIVMKTIQESIYEHIEENKHEKN